MRCFPDAPLQWLSIVLSTPFHDFFQLTNGIDGLKVAMLKEGFEGCQPDVAQLTREAALGLADRGATVAEVSLPLHNEGKNVQSRQPFHQ